jgi:dihydrofolate synthase / folylpolyglutamate synthase
MSNKLKNHQSKIINQRFIQAEKYLDQLQMFGIKLGLEQVCELATSVGNPHEQLRFIHLAGSNGKGSCAAMLGAALRAVGFKVGFFSSPHLISVRERFRINGQGISEADFIAVVDRLRPATEKMRSAGRCPTYFEFATVIAATYFAEQQVDFVLWETGMGGRLDATNFVTPYCSVITGIALEHQQYLGDTLMAIAGEKAGIIKPGRPVFVAKLPDDALNTINTKCAETSSELFQVNDALACRDVSFSLINGFSQSFKIKEYHLTIPLAGAMQRCNSQLVFMVLEQLASKFSFELQTALDGIKTARWPGRLQILADGTVIDGAHNPDGVEKLIAALNEIMPDKRFTVIFAAFADKDVLGALQMLDRIADRFIFMSLKGPSWRATYSGAELKNMFDSVSKTPAIAVNSLNEALDQSSSQPRLFAGSLFLAGEVLPHFVSKDEIIDI